MVYNEANNSYKPITNTAWVRTRLCKLQKRCTRLAAASDKDYQLLAHGQWFSPGAPASPTTKTGRHDIAEILLKVALKHQKSNQIIFYFVVNRWFTLLIVVIVSSFFIEYAHTALTYVLF
jgi:hypothetical protein